MDTAPLVSVILSMQDHRGLWTKAISSWTRMQTADPGSFELVLILDDTCRDLESGIRPLLRSHDLLLVDEGMDEMVQYDHGARSARGKFLFFTEPHCYAAPDAVAEIIAFFTDHPDTGLCAESAPVCRNRTAQMEFRHFEEGWRVWSQGDHWCRVIFRGFGIPRARYIETGGFRLRYGRFAEWLYAADLDAVGYRILIGHRVVIEHAYNQSFRRLDWFIRDFTEGEGLFYQDSPPGFFQKYFGTPPEWELYRRKPGHLVPLIRRLLFTELLALRSIGRSARGMTAGIPIAVGLLFRKLIGLRTRLMTARIRVLLAKIRYHLAMFNEDASFAAFRRYWSLSTTAARLGFLLGHPGARTTGTPVERQEYSIESMTADDLYGFHGIESHEGTCFRWTSPAAALRVAPKPGEYLATITLLNIRPLDPARYLALFWDGQRVRDVRHDSGSSSISFPVTGPMTASGGPHWLIMFYPPLALGRKERRVERRTLSLPVTGICFTEQAAPMKGEWNHG